MQSNKVKNGGKIISARTKQHQQKKQQHQLFIQHTIEGAGAGAPLLSSGDGDCCVKHGVRTKIKKEIEQSVQEQTQHQQQHKAKHD